MKILLIPFSILFRIIVFIRNFLYDKGLLKTSDLDVNIISVGNIAAGGTGKTPFVELLAELLLNKGKFVAIVLKGYKREHDDMKVVEIGFDNENHAISTESLGDEAFVLLENLSHNKNSKGLLVVGDDKSKTAKFAAAKFKPSVIIIDDGFQHRQLFRDLDIVIVTPESDKHMIPAGNLREPMKNMHRSDLIVINNKFEKDLPTPNLKNSPKIVCEYEFEGFFNSNNQSLNREDVTGAATFCGIGEPESFTNLMDKLNIKINGFIKFPDHHFFSIEDIERITEMFSKSGTKYLLTTQKDFVRIKNSELVLNSRTENAYKSLLYNYPLYYAKIKMQIKQNAELLNKEIDNLLN